MTKEKINTTNKIIIPKSGKDSLSDEARKRLLEDLQNISPEEIEEIGEGINNFEKNKIIEQEIDFDYVDKPVEIGGKLALPLKKDDKRFVIRGNEKCGGDFDGISLPREIGGKPVFMARNGSKYCIIRGNEKCGGDFDDISEPIEIGGKPAFVANSGKKWFIMLGNEKYSKNFSRIEKENLREAGGEPFYIAGKTFILAELLNPISDKEFVMRGKRKLLKYSNKGARVGERLVRGPNWKPKIIGGKPAFEVRNSTTGKKFVMRGDDKCGGDFDDVFNLSEIGGKPAFAARDGEKWFIMLGKEKYLDLNDFGKIGSVISYMWSKIRDIGGKPAFVVQEGGKMFVVRGKQRYSDDFDSIDRLMDIGGKPAFEVNVHSGAGKEFIMRGDKKCGGDFDDVFNLSEIGGKPVFRAVKHGRHYILRGDEQCREEPKYLPNVHLMGPIVEIGGKPATMLRENGRWHVVRFKDRYSDDFDDIKHLTDIGGKPAFAAKDGKKWFIMRGKDKYSGDFDEINNLMEIGGKPVFIAKKDGKRYKIGVKGAIL